MGTEEGEEPHISGIDRPFKRITEEKFPKLRKDTLIQTWKAHKMLDGRDQKRSNSWCSIDKTLNIQNIESFKGEATSHIERRTHHNNSWFLRQAQNNVLQVLRNHRCQPRLLYPAKLPVIVAGERKTSHDTNKLKAPTTTKPVHTGILETILRTEERNEYSQESRERKDKL